MVNAIASWDVFISNTIITRVITGLLTLLIGLVAHHFSSNARARRILKEIWGQNVSRPRLYMKHFVKRDFRTLYTTSSQLFTHRQLLRYIKSNDIKNSPIVFIIGEAGAGKTRLMQQYAYNLRARSDMYESLIPKLGLGTQVKCFSFSRLSITKLSDELNNCANPAHTIILLDGFDSCPELKTHSAEEVFDDLFSVMKKESSRFKRIVITTRIEAFAKGSEILGSKSILQKYAFGRQKTQPLVVAVQPLESKQIRQMFFAGLPFRDKHLRLSLFQRMQVSFKLRSYLRSLQGQCIFENAFFCGYADTILKASDIESSCLVEQYEAMQVIVNSLFQKEYHTQDKAGFLDTDNISENDFRVEIENILKEASLIMERENRNYIIDQELSENSVLYSNTRVLLVRNGEQLKFLHDLFFEYFLLLGVEQLDYITKYRIFNGEHSRINKIRANQYYIKMFVNNKYTIDFRLLIDCINTEIKSIEQLFSLEKVMVNPDTSIAIIDILNLLPLVKDVSFSCYHLYGENILDLMENGYLDLSSQNLVNLDNISAFGEFRSLDISGNKIEDLSALSVYSSLDKLILSHSCLKNLKQLNHMQIKIISAPVRNSDELHYLVNLSNVSEWYLLVEPELPSRTIKLYNDLYCYIESGTLITVTNLLPFSKAKEVFTYLEEVHANSEMEFLSAVIEFGENVLQVQDNQLLTQNSKTTQNFKESIGGYYYNRGNLHFNLLDYIAGLHDASRAVELSPSPRINYYRLLGQTNYHLSYYNQALEVFLLAYKLLKKNAYLDDSYAIFIMNGISKVYCAQANYPCALEYSQKAIYISEKVLGLEHPDTATTYNIIAEVYYRQGDYPKALEWNQKALKIREKVFDLEHPDTATTYNNIALVFYIQSDYPKALEWNQKALKIREKVFGLEHPANATSYNDIALVYNSQGDYTKALELYQKALKSFEKVFGLEHPYTATTYYNIALVYYNQGDYPRALEWYQKALKIREKVLGLEHPDTITVKDNIALVKDLI